MLESRGHDGRVHSHAAYVVQELALYSMEIMRAFAVVAGAVPPLIALLSSPSTGVQEATANALRNLGLNNENNITIATAGAIPTLIALFSSPSTGVQEADANALQNLGLNN